MKDNNEKNEEKYCKIELRSEEVQELIKDRLPFVLRYGICIVFLFIVILLFYSKNISCNNNINVFMTLLPDTCLKQYIANHQLQVIKMNDDMETKVGVGDTIAVLTTITDKNQANDTITIIANKDGYVYKPEKYKKGDIIPFGTEYLKVMPTESNNKVIKSISKVDEYVVSKLKKGMIAKSNVIPNYTFKITSISKIPDSKELFSVYFESTTTCKEIILYRQSIPINITIENSNVFDKFIIEGFKNTYKLK